MTRTDTTATITTTALTPALATVLRTAPVARAVAWEPTTLHASVVRRPVLAGTVPMPGQRLFGSSGAFEVGPAATDRPDRAPKHLRATRPWAVAVVLAAFVTGFAGTTASLLADRTPSAPAPGGTSVSAPAHVTTAGTPVGR